MFFSLILCLLYLLFTYSYSHCIPLSKPHVSYFYTEHQNYFGTDESLGPVAVSIRREKLDESKEKEGLQYNYRVAFRTSEVSFLLLIFCALLSKQASDKLTESC